MAAFTTGMVPQLSSMVYQIDPRIGDISRGHANVISLSWIDAFFCARDDTSFIWYVVAETGAVLLTVCCFA